MEKWMQSMFHFGNLLRREAPPITPGLNEFDVLEFLKPAYEKERTEDFKVLLNVSLLDVKEVVVEVVEGKILEIKAKHDRRTNKDGLWMTRDLTYTFEIPKKSQGKPLKATWSEDEFLLIEEMPEKKGDTETDKIPLEPEKKGDTEADKIPLEPEKKGDTAADRILLEPEKVAYNARQVIELRTVRDLIEDIRDKAADALRYIRTHMSDDIMREANAVFRATSKRQKKEDSKGEKMDCDEGQGSGESSKKEPPVRFYCA